ncbi:MAG: hypothetical protein IJ759_02940 [Bacteroidales bacterium]|nr:hypothetical protein [Bacteroidales bacterium]
MKKTKIILFAIAVGCFLTGYSQAIKSNTEGAYTWNKANSAFYDKFLTKTLSYNDTYKLTLSSAASGNSIAHYFALLQTNSTSTIRHLRITNDYVVRDFTILEDTVFFVGSYQNTCYLAYFKITDLINANASSDNINITYTTVIDESATNHTGDIWRIEAYKNDNGERVILCLGKMGYSYPGYWMYDGVGSGLVFHSFPENYHNVLIQYELTEQTMTASQALQSEEIIMGSGSGTVNKVKYYYAPFINNDTSYFFDNNEHFNDIAVTNSYVYLLSSSRDTIGNAWGTPGSKRDNLILRALDKNSLQPVLSKYINVSSPSENIYMQNIEDDGNNDGRAFIRSLGFDNIAIGYLHGYIDIKGAINSRYVVDFIEFDGERFQITDSQTEKNYYGCLPLLRDMEYDPDRENLWILKHSMSNDNDVAVLLRRFDNQQTNSYTAYSWSLEYNLNYTNRDKSIYNDLLYDDKGFMVISGVNQNYYLGIIDKDLDAMQIISKYFAPIGTNILRHTDESKDWINRDNLNTCSFPSLTTFGNHYTFFKYTRTETKTFISSKGGSMVTR